VCFWKKRKISLFTVSSKNDTLSRTMLPGTPLMFLIRTPLFTRAKIEMLEGQLISRVLNES
jgi:hypothetical protein